MPDPINNVNTGDTSPYINQKDVINATLESVRRARETRFNTPSVGAGSKPAPPLPPAVRVWIRNDTGADLDALSVVAIGNSTIDLNDEDDPFAAVGAPCFSGTTPASTSDAFAILTDAIAKTDNTSSANPRYFYGRAVVLGVVVVDVNVTDVDHEFATPTASDGSQLTSATAGPARILSDVDGTGTQRCAVLLTGPGGSLSYDVASLAATLYSITANDAWQDTGLSIDLPDADSYVLFANVTGLAQMSAITGSIPPYVQVRFYNVTASTPVLVDGAGNETIVVQPPVTGLTFLNTAAITAPITVAVPTTIRLEAKRNTVFGSGTFSAAQIYRADGQPVNMGYAKVG